MVITFDATNCDPQPDDSHEKNRLFEVKFLANTILELPAPLPKSIIRSQLRFESNSNPAMIVKPEVKSSVSVDVIVK